MSRCSSGVPDAISSRASPAPASAARLIGDSDIICEPTWKCSATTRRAGSRPASRMMAAASPIGTPNLFERSPVEMCGWLIASTSGFTRSATRASVPRAFAIAAMRSSSPADSALMAFTPMPTARSSSSCVLPTPVKTIAEGANPARRATSISPPEFASARAAELLEERRDRERGVGLERVVQRVRIRAERRIDRAVARRDLSRAVDVDRRSRAGRDRGKRNAVA